MPARIYDSGRTPKYLDPTQDPQYRQREVDRKLSQISKLGQAFQNYYTNRKDRQLLEQMGVLSSGPLAQAQGATPNVEVLQGPGGAQPVTLGQEELARQNAMNQVASQQLSAARPRRGMLARVGDWFDSIQPLSPVEKSLMAVHPAFQTPKELAYARYYGRRPTTASTRSPRGFDEIQEVWDATEIDRRDSEEERAYKIAMRTALLQELGRYVGGTEAAGESEGSYYFPGIGRATREEVEATAMEYGMTVPELMEELNG